ncbi:hypothetical protein DHW03_17475 [Pedobacter yonginense]|uniref:Competence protein ComEA n=1 Tax=Pedobacter yonginense TaxID=651869 RepID=A0A317EIU8_9SPHI|nr:helix-hairpin-helix domain-containing protein [Pedobacter yonginense]PWS26562.1 hypothetical protein DHW03_17475 [Pedobacter yonginense]
MRIWLNKHFGFTKGEFNGLLLLIIIIFALKATPFIYEQFHTAEKDDLNLLAKIQKLEISDQNDFHYARERIEELEATKETRLFAFDPNTIDVEGWQTLGLSVKQASSIVNYRNKGGKFYKAEDLQKMYTISPDMYQKLLPYVHIENQTSNYSSHALKYEKKEYAKKALVIVDVNTADSAQLDEVKGIGGAFANRILKYRERLGGFYKKEQLMEVYGIDSIKYAEIKNQISLSPVKLKTINLNTAVFNDLKSNPYLSYKQINAIIQFRKQHGTFSSPSDLKKIAILNQQIIDKISPYITF